MQRPKTVLSGKDFQVLDILIPLHCGVDKPYILDCTYNKGVMWKNCKYSPSIKMDISNQYPVDVVADFMKMPFPNNLFDIIVFDCPHLPTNAASANSSKIWEKQYGITANDERRKKDHVCDLFEPFLIEAKRTLKPEGIILAKIADLIHNHHYQWQQVEFINKVIKTGLTACDMMIKVDPSAGNLQSSKWKKIMHLRKCHSYWIICRKGKCERRKLCEKIEN